MTVYSEENQNAGLIYVYLNSGWWIPLTHLAKVRMQAFFRAINRRHARNGILLRTRINPTEILLLQELARTKGFTIKLRKS